MTEAMPFLQKAILLSYDPRPFCGGALLMRSLMGCKLILMETKQALLKKQHLFCFWGKFSRQGSLFSEPWKQRLWQKESDLLYCGLRQKNAPFPAEKFPAFYGR